LFDSGDVGLIPWVPLTKFKGRPGPILAECRRQIDARAAPEERANLLAVTQILARLRYNDARLLQILGGFQAMIESPLIQEIVAYKLRKVILDLLVSRFGAVARDVGPALQAIEDEARLEGLVVRAGMCPDLEAFRRGIAETDVNPAGAD
jgi:hypothetical protein